MLFDYLTAWAIVEFVAYFYVNEMPFNSRDLKDL